MHRVSVEGFHRPAQVRHARGRTAETFYRDQYDHDTIRHRLVEPFRAGEPWLRAVHDVEREVPVDLTPEPATRWAGRRPAPRSGSISPSTTDAPPHGTAGPRPACLPVVW